MSDQQPETSAELRALARDEMSALRAENAALKKALTPLAHAEDSCDRDFSDDTTLGHMLSGDNITLGDIRHARATLLRALNVAPNTPITGKLRTPHTLKR